MDGSGIGVDMYADDNEIYGNLSYGNDGPGISLASDSGNYVHDNTVYGNGLNTAGVTEKLAEIRVTGKTELDADNFIIENNIAYATAPSVYAIYVDSYAYDNNPTITNNVWYAPNVMNWFYWGTSNSPAGTVWNDLAGVGTDTYGDPLMVNPAGHDFTLQAASAAIDAGYATSYSPDYASSSVYGAVDIGAYEYQPILDQAEDLVDPTRSLRIYSDGKFRPIGSGSGSATADFAVAPAGGSYPTASTSIYMDVAIDSWQTSGDKNKQWTASSSVATGTLFTIGNLLVDTGYTVKIDGVASSTLVSGSSCSAAVCTSDGSGRISFTYSGGWSSHVFKLEKVVQNGGGGSSGGGGGGGSYVTPTIPTPGNNPVSVIGGNRIVGSVANFSFNVSNAAYFSISEDRSFAGASWMAYVTNYGFALSGNEGQKTVYVKFRSSSGGETQVFSINVERVAVSGINAGVNNSVVSLAPSGYVAKAKGGDGTIYYVENGTKHRFLNPTVMKSWFFKSDAPSSKGVDWAKAAVREIAADDFAFLIDGGDVGVKPQGSFLVQFGLNTPVYYVGPDFRLFRLSSPWVAKQAFGENWGKKVVVFPANYNDAGRYGPVSDFQL